MGIIRKIFRVLSPASGCAARLLSHGARNEIKHEHQRALDECNRLEQNALQQLHAQYKMEHDKLEQQRIALEVSRNQVESQLDLQKRLKQSIEDREKEFKENLEYIKNSFELLRIALQACVEGKNEIIEPVLQNDDLRMMFFEFFPLHFAADNNQVATLQLLCRYGADPQKKYGAYGTALDVAEFRNCEKSCLALKDIMKQTAIFWEAVDKGDREAMKIALEGAAINASLNGYNILQKAINDQKPYEIIRWLVEMGADCYHPNSPFQGSLSAQETSPLQEAASSQKADHNLKGQFLHHISQFNAFRLTEDHPDWRVADFLMSKWETEVEPSCITLDHTLSKQPLFHSLLSRHLTSTLSSSHHHSAARLSAFVTVQGRKKLISVASNKGLSIISYDCGKKNWSQEFLSTGDNIILNDSTNKVHLNRLRGRDSDWQKSQAPDLEAIQLQSVRTSQGKEKLYLLAQQSSKDILFWQYDAESQRWKMSRPGPRFEDQKKIDMEFCANNGGIELVLLIRRGENIELWRYNPERDEWKPCPSTINRVTYQPQLTLLDQDNKTQAFVLLERFASPNDYIHKKIELCSYDLNSDTNNVEQSWTLHPETPWSQVAQNQRSLQMQRVQVGNEARLFFLYRFSGGMQLWSYNPKVADLNLRWRAHLGAPTWALKDTRLLLSDRDIVQMQVVPGHEKNSDIILCFRHSKTGIECYVYHPLSEHWEHLDIPGLSAEQFHLREEYQNIQIQVELIQNQHRIAIFCSSPSQSLELNIQCWSHSLNIKTLEKKLTENKALISSRPVLSQEHLEKAREFWNRHLKYSDEFINASRRGDIPALIACLENGANVYATDAEGYNALQLLLRHPLDLGTLKHLLKAGLAPQYRGNIQRTNAIEVARNSNPELYEYLADLYDRPALSWMPDIQTTFKKKYLEQMKKTERFLNKDLDEITKCHSILTYYRIVNNANPFALYTWVGMLMMGETLSQLPSILKENNKKLQEAQVFFMKTRAVHKALSAVGVENYHLLEQDLTLRNSNWTHIINTIHIQEAAETYAKKNNLSEFTEEDIKAIYSQNEVLVLQGVRSAFTAFAKAMQIDDSKESWIETTAEWMVEKLITSPCHLKQLFKEYWHQHFESTASLAKDASDLGLPHPPKLNSQSVIHKMEERCLTITEKEKIKEQNFLREKAEFEQWLKQREEECNKCIEDLNELIASSDKMSVDIKLQLNRGISDIHQQFSQFRRDFEANKEEALHKVQKKAFKMVVIMVASSGIASTLAPLMASGIGSASALGLSAQGIGTLEVILKGALYNGLTAAGTHQNILKSAFKGAAYAGFGQVLGGMMSQVINPASSPMHFTLHTAITTGIETGSRSIIEKDKIAENLITNISTAILSHSKSGTQPKSRDFMPMLRENLYRAFVGGTINALANKRNIGSSIATAAVTAGCMTGAELMGSELAERIAQSYNLIPENETKRAAENARQRVERSLPSHRDKSPIPEGSLNTKGSIEIPDQGKPLIFSRSINPEHQKTRGQHQRKATVLQRNSDVSTIRSENEGSESILYKKNRSKQGGQSTISTLDFRVLNATSIVHRHSDLKSHDANRKPIQNSRWERIADQSHFQDPLGIRLGMHNDVSFCANRLSTSAVADYYSSLTTPSKYYFSSNFDDSLSDYTFGLSPDVNNRSFTYIPSHQQVGYFRSAARKCGRFALDTLASGLRYLEENPRIALLVDVLLKSSDALTSYGVSKLGPSLDHEFSDTQSNIQHAIGESLRELEATYSIKWGLNKEDKASIASASFLILGKTKCIPRPYLSKFKDPFKSIPKNKQIKYLENEIGAHIGREHVDLTSGTGGANSYENFARAREIARINANLGEDAVPFLSRRIGPQRNNVYTGMRSKEGDSGWRLDRDPNNLNKGIHINWWCTPDPNNKRLRYNGLIKLDMDKDTYREIISRFPRKEQFIGAEL